MKTKCLDPYHIKNSISSQVYEKCPSCSDNDFYDWLLKEHPDSFLACRIKLNIALNDLKLAIINHFKNILKVIK